LKTKRKFLGEMLLESGLLTREQLDLALADHKKAGLRLGEYLIRKGILREPQICEVISKQLRIEQYRPDLYPYDTALQSLIPAELAQRHRLVPLMRKGSLLVIAMADPMDINALDAVEVQANIEVEPVICTERELNQLMSGIYGVTSGLGEVIDSVEEMTIEPDTPAAVKDIQVSSLHDMAEEAPIVRLVNSILAQAVRERASDIHISPEQKYVQLRFRVDGALREVPAPPKSLFLPIVSRLKILAQLDIAISRVPQDGRFTFFMDRREINVRVSTMPTIYGENVVMRLLDMSAGGYTLEELGMGADDLAKIGSVITKPYGMILSTGPTGSGKSTTLYAVLRRVNNAETNIITLEDPVEYRIEKIRQVQLNRKAGMNFANGLRSILRQDPDVIMVGEIRDSETAQISVQAALTGHKLLSTMHTNDAAGAVSRLMDMGVEPFLVSSVLLVSIAQRLVRANCPHCAEPYSPPEEAIRVMGLENANGATFMRSKGCYQCQNTGFQGRTGIYEILVNDELVQNMILKRASTQEITRAAVGSGSMRTLKEAAALKAAQGVTTLEEAASAVLV
jgi:type IV pilus assembly protein PilB